jgi:putative nucleotidyltransferase with HDIG domain
VPNISDVPLPPSQQTDESLLRTLELLAYQPEMDHWSGLLKAAVEGVPGAEGGCIWLRRDKNYIFVSQMGYDEQLLQMMLNAESAVSDSAGVEGWALGLPRVQQATDLHRTLKFDHCKSQHTSTMLEGFTSHIQTSLAVPVLLNHQVVAELSLESYTDPEAFGEASVEAARAFSLQLSALLLARRHQSKLDAAYEGSLRAVGMALEARDLDTAGHTDRVVQLVEKLGAALSLSPIELRDLRWGAYLHDIGKLMIPETVLLKPGRLNRVEQAMMQSHPELGEQLIQKLPFVADAVGQIVRSHHERWDGKGYPDNLAGEYIPLAARAFAVCDVFDALRSKRPDKLALPFEQALLEIARCGQNGQLDPGIVRVFLGVVEGEE